MSQIRDLIVKRVVETLETGMITNVPRSNPTRANLVKAYRFQADPQDVPIYMYVTAGDISDLSYQDGRVSKDDMENLGMSLPAGEIGGGHLWWRRGKVEIGCYFVVKKYTQALAAEYAHEVLGRAASVLESTVVADLADSFGERAYQIMMYSNVFYEGGGPPDQYIWRGSIYWQALTERSR